MNVGLWIDVPGDSNSVFSFDNNNNGGNNSELTSRNNSTINNNTGGEFLDKFIF